MRTRTHLEPGHVRQHAQPEAGAEVLHAYEPRQLAELVRAALGAVGAVHPKGDEHGHAARGGSG